MNFLAMADLAMPTSLRTALSSYENLVYRPKYFIASGFTGNVSMLTNNFTIAVTN